MMLASFSFTDYDALRNIVDLLDFESLVAFSLCSRAFRIVAVSCAVLVSRHVVASADVLLPVSKSPRLFRYLTIDTEPVRRAAFEQAIDAGTCRLEHVRVLFLTTHKSPVPVLPASLLEKLGGLEILRITGNDPASASEPIPPTVSAIQSFQDLDLLTLKGCHLSRRDVLAISSLRNLTTLSFVECERVSLDHTNGDEQKHDKSLGHSAASITSLAIINSDSLVSPVLSHSSSDVRFLFLMGRPSTFRPFTHFNAFLGLRCLDTSAGIFAVLAGAQGALSVIARIEKMRLQVNSSMGFLGDWDLSEEWLFLHEKEDSPFRTATSLRSLRLTFLGDTFPHLPEVLSTILPTIPWTTVSVHAFGRVRGLDRFSIIGIRPVQSAEDDWRPVL